MVAAYKSGRIEEKKVNFDSNAAVIAQALKSVTPENQISCLIINLFNRWSHICRGTKIIPKGEFLNVVKMVLDSTFFMFNNMFTNKN